MNEAITTKRQATFDLKQRSFEFGVRVLRLSGRIPRTIAGVEITRQLIRAATSVGANVEEADGAESRKDTAHKMRVARKEARESQYWLRMLVAADLVREPEIAEAKGLAQEAGELVRILSTIIHKVAQE